nr:ATP-binding cassette domain-containing protein [Verrucomicrobium spinosum]
MERKARRDAAGRRKSAKGGEPPILLGARKDRAEDSGGVGARLAERRRSEAAEGLSAARGRLEVIQPFTVALAPSGLPAGKTVLEVNAVTAGYEPGQPIVRDVSFSITGPERVAVQGRNGSGKTTLLQVISGKLAPWAGSVRLGVPFAMLDQQVSLLIPQLSIRDNYRKLNPDSDENACRSSLARFRFRADAALQTVATLSGGQLLRAGLACVLGGTHPPPLLILDEGQMTTLPPSGMPSWSSTRTLKAGHPKGIAARGNHPLWSSNHRHPRQRKQERSRLGARGCCQP